MFKRALIPKRIPGHREAQPYTLPAPTGGWNARDSLATMPPLDAIELVNWFPGSSEVILRSGAFRFRYGFPTTPGALLVYQSPSGDQMLACTNTRIYSSSIPGAVTSGLTANSNSRCIGQNITTPGGSFLMVVNGTDPVKYFDGTNFVTPGISGLTSSDVTNVALMASRIWFSVTQSIDAYYLAVDSISGAATKFPLGTVLTDGGYLMAMGSWTVDGGSGSDDYSVFISSKGQVAVYRGIDPASVDTWQKVGVYNLAPPLGRKCAFKFGGDLIIITRSGLFPLSKALQSASISNISAITNKIDTAFINAAKDGAEVPGWVGVVFSEEGFLLINVPDSSGHSSQFVMNTVTNAWCKFQGWDGTDFAIFNHKLYFTYANGVAEAYTVETDFGADITAQAAQAFNTLGSKMNKQITLLRPIFTLASDTAIEIGIATDYGVAKTTSNTSIDEVIDGSLWDTGKWDTAIWGGSTATIAHWMTAWSDPCYAAAVVLRVSDAIPKLSWSATTLVYKPGGIL